ncbi:unnamed protein product [Bursaphelenchus xylophilus]|uniref:(pine wood nematode) hypothetical protein n=1 Tax=Bursaphelenchus xylophilus TaxID=6326 RepID=A0A1I7SSY9_BURXY|nr:unnamed protein product [Bursaphelenchus xylophilus]CAG9108833.1 unnamed protein product [Bursaphelenchus xylophilus]
MSLLTNVKRRVSGLLKSSQSEVAEPKISPEERPDEQKLEEAKEENPKQESVFSDAVSDSIVPEEPTPSNLRDDVYIQSRRSFKRTTNEALRLSTIIGEVSPDKDIRYYSSVYTAIKLQDIFHKIVVLLLGCLAGVTIYHTVIAFFIIVDEKTVLAYQQVGAHVQAACYFSFSLFVIRCLDMIESGNGFKNTMKKLVSMQKDILVFIIAMIGFVCSTLMTRYEEENILKDRQSLMTWRWLSAGRAVTALIGWLMISLQRGSDCTQQRLIAITREYQEKQEKMLESSHERALSSLTNSRFDLSQDFDNPTHNV